MLRTSLIRRYSVAQIVALAVPTRKPNDRTTQSQSNPLVLLQRTYPIRISFNIILQYVLRSPIYCLPLMFSNKNHVLGTVWYANATNEASLYPFLKYILTPARENVTRTRAKRKAGYFFLAHSVFTYISIKNRFIKNVSNIICSS